MKDHRIYEIILTPQADGGFIAFGHRGRTR